MIKSKRPRVLFSGHISKLLWGGLASLVVILAVSGIYTLKNEPPAYSSEQPSLPAIAAIEDNSIKFEVETVLQSVSGENYFVNYRLKRDQFRQETKTMLSELLNSTVDKTKEKAQEQWLELSTKMHKEGEVENLLKIKGFQDAVADVLQENVTVIVYAPSLTQSEVGIIQDTVVRVTKVRPDKISISTRE